MQWKFTENLSSAHMTVFQESKHIKWKQNAHYEKRNYIQWLSLCCLKMFQHSMKFIDALHSRRAHKNVYTSNKVLQVN